MAVMVHFASATITACYACENTIVSRAELSWSFSLRVFVDAESISAERKLASVQPYPIRSSRDGWTVRVAADALLVIDPGLYLIENETYAVVLFSHGTKDENASDTVVFIRTAPPGSTHSSNGDAPRSFTAIGGEGEEKTVLYFADRLGSFCIGNYAGLSDRARVPLSRTSDSNRR